MTAALQATACDGAGIVRVALNAALVAGRSTRGDEVRAEVVTSVGGTSKVDPRPRPQPPRRRFRIA